MGLYAALHPDHTSHYYGIVHGTIFLASTAVMGLMGWIMSPPTQGQLTGGDDATGNLPGFVFLMVSTNNQFCLPQLSLLFLFSTLT